MFIGSNFIIVVKCCSIDQRYAFSDRSCVYGSFIAVFCHIMQKAFSYTGVLCLQYQVKDPYRKTSVSPSQPVEYLKITP